MGRDGGLVMQMSSLHRQIAEANRRIAELTAMRDEAARNGNNGLANICKKRLVEEEKYKWGLKDRLNRIRGCRQDMRRGRAKHYKRIGGEHRIPHKRMKR